MIYSALYKYPTVVFCIIDLSETIARYLRARNMQETFAGYLSVCEHDGAVRKVSPVVTRSSTIKIRGFILLHPLMECNVNKKACTIRVNRTFVDIVPKGRVAGHDSRFSFFDMLNVAHMQSTLIYRYSDAEHFEMTFSGAGASKVVDAIRRGFFALYADIRVGDITRFPAQYHERDACPVCLDEFDPGQRCAVLRCCDSNIHVVCLKELFLRHSKCPLCRFHGCLFCGGLGCKEDA